MTNYQRLLAFDTSTSSMAVAVLKDGEIAAESHAIAERNHSIYLVPSIIETMTRGNVTMNDLEAIVVGKGPGSYTGIRIAASVAKTLSWSLNLPLVGVSSLEALASASGFSSHRQIQWVCPLMDARRGQVYTGLYRAGENGTICLKEDGVRLFTEWLNELNTFIEENDAKGDSCQLVFVGNTAPFLERIQSTFSGKIDVACTHSDIQAREVARLGLRALQRGEQLQSVHRFTPNYTQLAEAEVKLLQKKRERV